MCENILRDKYYLANELKANKSETFESAFWNHVIKHISPILVINRYVFSYREIEKGESFSKAKHRYIKLIGTLDVKHITNIWRIGRAPEDFADNAILIDKDEYYRIKNICREECRMKGCWDRYRCVWYKSSEPNGAWNDIPEDYTPGIEQCESFLDKTTIK